MRLAPRVPESIGATEAPRQAESRATRQVPRGRRHDSRVAAAIVQSISAGCDPVRMVPKQARRPNRLLTDLARERRRKTFEACGNRAQIGGNNTNRV